MHNLLDYNYFVQTFLRPLNEVCMYVISWYSFADEIGSLSRTPLLLTVVNVSLSHLLIFYTIDQVVVLVYTSFVVADVSATK